MMHGSTNVRLASVICMWLVACDGGGGGCIMHDMCLGPLHNTVYMLMSR